MRPVLRVLAALLIFLVARSATADVWVKVRYGHGQEAVAGAITPLVVEFTSTEPEPLGFRVRTRPGTTLGAGEVCNAADVLSTDTTKQLTFLYRPYARTRPIVELSFDRAVFVVADGERSKKAVRETTVLPPKRPPTRGSESYSRFTLLAVGYQAGRLPTAPDGIRILPMEERDLAEVWHAYDGIDAVLLRNPAEEETIDPGRIDALLRFVEMGGRLIVSARRPDRVREIGLFEHLPADLGDILAEGMSVLELAMPFKARRQEEVIREPGNADLFRLSPRAGSRVLATEPGLAAPLVVERDYGYGTIVLVAFDTARFAPLPKLWAISFYSVFLGGDRAIDASDDPEGNIGRLFPSGGAVFGGDVSDQPLPAILRLLRAGAVRAPPMGLLFLFMVLYILAVGPIDYWILKKRRMLKWSAFSFLALAVVFSVTAWFVSFYLFAGADRLNRVTWVDIMPGPEGGPDRVVLHDMAGFYAPRGDQLVLAPVGDTVHVSDLATPDSYDGSGGLRRDPIELSFATAARARGELIIPFRSLRTTRSLLAREQTVPLDVTFTAEAVTVRNGLPFRLRGAVILTPERVRAGRRVPPGIVHIGDLDANQEVTRPIQPLRITYRGVGGLTEPGADTPSSAHLRKIAESLLPVSWAARGHEAPDSDWVAHFRTLAKLGLDRSPALQRGSTLFAAWTDERDPFGLSADAADGFTLTLIRKVIRQ